MKAFKIVFRILAAPFVLCLLLLMTLRLWVYGIAYGWTLDVNLKPNKHGPQ